MNKLSNTDRTKLAIRIFDKAAKEYQDKFMEMDLYNDTYDLFCNSVEKTNASVLEIACGPGNITKYLLGKRPDFKILGTDLSAKMLELATVNNPSANFQILDCRDIGKLGKRFDAIMCGFCLPYLSKVDSIKLINDASDVLTSSGTLYLSTLEGDYKNSGYKGSSSGGPDKMYIYYHQQDYLIKALKDSGFNIIKIENRDFHEQNGDINKDLIIISKK